MCNIHLQLTMLGRWVKHGMGPLAFIGNMMMTTTTFSSHKKQLFTGAENQQQPPISRPNFLMVGFHFPPLKPFVEWRKKTNFIHLSPALFMHSWKSTYTPNCPKDLIKKLIYIPVYAVKYTHAYFIYSSDAESLHKSVSLQCFHLPHWNQQLWQYK